MEQWVPLNREQALAARDFSRAGETFVDYNGQVNEILYSILTPLDYRSYVSIQMEKMEIRIAGGVVEFIFGPSKRIVFNDEDQPGLEIGRDKRSRKIVGYMCLHFPGLHRRIFQGLKEKPITKKFSVEMVEDYENVTPICDPRVKNATFAEIVQWVWEKYYAHLEQDTAVESSV